MQFTHRQKQHFFENGYVPVPGVVPRVRVDAALRAINHAAGQGMDPAQMTKFRAQSYFPDVQGTPPITDLLVGTPAWELAESLIGEGQINPRPGRADRPALPRDAGPAASARRTH